MSKRNWQRNHYQQYLDVYNNAIVYEVTVQDLCVSGREETSLIRVYKEGNGHASPSHKTLSTLDYPFSNHERLRYYSRHCRYRRCNYQCPGRLARSLAIDRLYFYKQISNTYISSLKEITRPPSNTYLIFLISYDLYAALSLRLPAAATCLYPLLCLFVLHLFTILFCCELCLLLCSNFLRLA